MKPKLLGRLAAAVALLLSATTGYGTDFEVDGIYYNYNEDELSVSVTYKGNYSLSYNEYSGTVVIPSSVIYSGKSFSVTSIGDFAFDGCNGLSALDIPNSVTSIGDYAFSGCSSLTSFKVSSSISSLGNGVIYGCTNLESLIVESENTTYYSIDNCVIETATNTMVLGAKNSIIPNNVTKIGDYAFIGCYGLTSVEMPSSVKEIGVYAFAECKGLTSLTIPGSVTSINERAFSNCINLGEIVIPSSVTYIEDRAFYGCSSLQTIISQNPTPPTLPYEKYTFLQVPTTCVLYVPEESLSYYRGHLGWSYFTSIEAIPGTDPSDVTCDAVQDDVNPADFYATFSNNAADVELHAAADASLTVYDVTVSGSTLVLTPREGNTKVARGEAVLVKTSYNTFTASPLSGSSLTPAKYGTTTLLLATPSETQTVSCDATEAKLYRLTYSDAVAKTGLGFYWGNAEGTQINAKPGKGYLKVPVGMAAEIKGFRINPQPTHVDGINAEVQGTDEPIYDLSGRRVENPTSGIYLQNNKKIIVK